MINYKHTQINPISSFLLPISPIVFYLVMQYNNLGVFDQPIILSIFLFFIFIISFFSRMTVLVNDEKISINFLCFRCKKHFYFKDIVGVKIVKNYWYHGWGIRIIPKGVLFNVYGLDAIELNLKTGKRIRIGTDEPDILFNIIKNAIKKV